MKKQSISVVLLISITVVIILFSGCAGNGVTKGSTEYSGEMSVSKPEYVEYTYTDGPEASVSKGIPYVRLKEKDKSFEFCYSALSSYIAKGNYEMTSSELVLTTKDDYSYRYVFDIDDAGNYVFNEKESSAIPKYDYKGNTGTASPVPDKAIFCKSV